MQLKQILLKTAFRLKFIFVLFSNIFYFRKSAEPAEYEKRKIVPKLPIILPFPRKKSHAYSSTHSSNDTFKAFYKKTCIDSGRSEAILLDVIFDWKFTKAFLNYTKMQEIMPILTKLKWFNIIMMTSREKGLSLVNTKFPISNVLFSNIQHC